MSRFYQLRRVILAIPFYEFYLYADKHPVITLAMMLAYGYIIYWIWKTPINPETQRSAGAPTA